MTGEAPGFIYARDGHPNAVRLASILNRLEGAAWGQVCGSGMAAISAAVLPLVQAGDRIVASDRLYGKTSQLLRQELRRFDVKTEVVDITDLSAVRRVLAEPARLLFVETLSNPLPRLAHVPELAAMAHAAGCRLVVDNTFATPVLFRPLEHHADLVVESLTKLIAGHSDVTLGWLGGHTVEEKPAVDRVISAWGFASNPFDCWLAERGLATLELRARAATANAGHIARWLREQSGVTRVVYPGLEDHPDFALAKSLLPDGAGHMLAFELVGGREAVNRFMHAAPGIPFSPSLGHFATTLSHPATTSHRNDSPAERTRQGIGDGLIRLSVGCEEVGRIQDELQRGLTA